STRSTYVAKQLTNGTTYEWRVLASNGDGDSPWSNTVFVTPAPMVPSRVRLVRAVTGGGLVRLQWRSVSGRGAAIQRYRIERRTPGGAWGTPVNVVGTTTTATITGVAAGTQLQFRVRAENSVGAGAWSSPIPVTVDGSGTVPDPVAGVVVTPSDGVLAVSWPAPNDGGSALIRYEVQIRTGGGSFGGTRNVAADQLATEYSGLTNGVTYDVRVRALNVVGPGDWSTPASGSPAP
ncbi:MAG: fibronectin type III domain-containing protein, partial [Actinomycetota bacterium]